MKQMLKPSIYWLFLFIPVTVMLEKTEARDTYIFFCAALSIIPLAKLIGASTEHLSHYTGDAVGGLLNATFGNAPELIISLIALNAGLYDMVLASIVGAILANLLLATGVSFLVGGVKYHTQEYNPASIRVYTSMMFIAVCSMIIPSAYSRFLAGNPAEIARESTLNIGFAISLLVAYGLYLYFMIKTHPDSFKSVAPANEPGEAAEKHWSIMRAVATLVAASVGAAFVSEMLVGAAEGTGKELGMSTTFIGIVFVAVIGGAAESFAAIAMAGKNKVDLTMSIALGSSIQIALFVAPLLVLLSFVIGPHPMYFVFSKGATGILLMAVLLSTVIAGDGKSNWYKGVQLILLYLLIALALYFIPEAPAQ